MMKPTLTVIGVLAVLCAQGAAQRTDAGDAAAAIRREAAPLRKPMKETDVEDLLRVGPEGSSAPPLPQILDLLLTVKADVHAQQQRDTEAVKEVRESCSDQVGATKAELKTETDNLHAISARRERLLIAKDAFEKEISKVEAQVKELGGEGLASRAKPDLEQAIRDAEQQQAAAMSAMRATEDAVALIKGLLLKGQGGAVSFLELSSQRVSTSLRALAGKLADSNMPEQSQELEEVLNEAETTDRTVLSDRLSTHLMGLRMNLQETLSQLKQRLGGMRGELQHQVDHAAAAKADPKSYTVKTDRARRVTALLFAKEELQDKLDAVNEELRMVDVEVGSTRIQAEGTRKALNALEGECQQAEEAFMDRTEARKGQIEAVSNAGTVLSGQLTTLHELLDPSGDSMLRESADTELAKTVANHHAHAEAARNAFKDAISVSETASTRLAKAVAEAKEAHDRVIAAHQELVSKMNTAAQARQVAKEAQSRRPTGQDVENAKAETEEAKHKEAAAEGELKKAQERLDLTHAELVSYRAREEEARLESEAQHASLRAQATSAAVASYRSHKEIAQRELEHARKVLNELEKRAKEAPEGSEDDAYLVGTETREQLQQDVSRQKEEVERLDAAAATASAHVSDLEAGAERLHTAAATAAAALESNEESLEQAEADIHRLQALGVGPVAGEHGEGVAGSTGAASTTGAASATGIAGLRSNAVDATDEVARAQAHVEKMQAREEAATERLNMLRLVYTKAPVQAVEAELQARRETGRAREAYKAALRTFASAEHEEEHTYSNVIKTNRNVDRVAQEATDAERSEIVDKRNKKMKAAMAAQLRNGEEVVDTLTNTNESTSKDEVGLASARMSNAAAVRSTRLTAREAEAQSIRAQYQAVHRRYRHVVSQATHLDEVTQRTLSDSGREHGLSRREKAYSEELQKELESARSTAESLAKEVKTQQKRTAEARDRAESGRARVEELTSRRDMLEKELAGVRGAAAGQWLVSDKNKENEASIVRQLKSVRKDLDAAAQTQASDEEALSITERSLEASRSLAGRASAVVTAMEKEAEDAAKAAKEVAEEAEESKASAKTHGSLAAEAATQAERFRSQEVAARSKYAEAQEELARERREAQKLFAQAKKELTEASQQKQARAREAAAAQKVARAAVASVSGQPGSAGHVDSVKVEADADLGSPFDTVDKVEADVHRAFEQPLGATGVAVSSSSGKAAAATGASGSLEVRPAPVVQSSEGKLAHAAESAILELAGRLGLMDVHGPSADAVHAAESKQKEAAAENEEMASSEAMQRLNKEQMAFARDAGRKVADRVKRRAQWMTDLLRKGGESRFRLREAQLRAATAQSMAHILKDETMRGQLLTLWNHALVLGTPAMATGAGAPPVPANPTGAAAQFEDMFHNEMPDQFPSATMGITGAEGVDRLEESDMADAHLDSFNADVKKEAARAAKDVEHETVVVHRTEHDALAAEAESSLVQPDRRSVAREEVMKSAEMAKVAMAKESRRVEQLQDAQRREAVQLTRERFVRSTIKRANQQFRAEKARLEEQAAKQQAKSQKKISSLEEREESLEEKVERLRAALAEKNKVSEATGATGAPETEDEKEEKVREKVTEEVIKSLAPTGPADEVEEEEQEVAEKAAEKVTEPKEPVAAEPEEPAARTGATGAEEDDFNEQREAELAAQEKFEKAWVDDAVHGDPLSGSLTGATGGACSKTEFVEGFGDICVEHKVKLQFAKKISHVKREVHHAKATATDLRKTVDSLSKTKTRLEEQVRQLRDREASHEHMLSSVQSELRGMMKSRQAQLAAAKDEIKAVAPRLDALTQRMHEIRKDITSAHHMVHVLGHAHKPMLAKAMKHLEELKLESRDVQHARNQLESMLHGARSEITGSLQQLGFSGPTGSTMDPLAHMTHKSHTEEEEEEEDVGPKPASTGAATGPAESEASKGLEKAADELKVKAQEKELEIAELERQLQHPGVTDEDAAAMKDRVAKLDREVQELRTESSKSRAEARQVASLAQSAEDAGAETVQEVAEDLEVKAAEAELAEAKQEKEADALSGEAGIEASRRAAAARSKAEALRAQAKSADEAARAEQELEARKTREQSLEEEEEREAYRQGAAVAAIARALGVEQDQKKLTKEQLEAASEVAKTFKTEKSKMVMRAQTKGAEMAEEAMRRSEMEAISHGATGGHVESPTGLMGAVGMERDALEEIANRQFLDGASRDAVKYDAEVDRTQGEADSAADSAEEMVDHLKERDAQGVIPTATGLEGSVRAAQKNVAEAHLAQAAAEGGATVAAQEAKVVGDYAEDRGDAYGDAQSYSHMLKQAAEEAQQAVGNAEVASEIVGSKGAHLEEAKEAAERANEYKRKAETTASIARIAASRTNQAARAKLHTAGTRASEADTASHVVNYETLGHTAAWSKLATEQHEAAKSAVDKAHNEVQEAASTAEDTPSMVPAAEQVQPEDKAKKAMDLPSVARFRATAASLTPADDGAEASISEEETNGDAVEANATEDASWSGSDDEATSGVRHSGKGNVHEAPTAKGDHGSPEEIVAQADEKARAALLAKKTLDKEAHHAHRHAHKESEAAEAEADSAVSSGSQDSEEQQSETAEAAHTAAEARANSDKWSDVTEAARKAYGSLGSVVDAKGEAAAAEKQAALAHKRMSEAQRRALELARGVASVPGAMQATGGADVEDCDGEECGQEAGDERHSSLEAAVRLTRSHSNRAVRSANEAAEIVRSAGQRVQGMVSFLQLDAGVGDGPEGDEESALVPNDPKMRAQARKEEAQREELENKKLKQALGSATGTAGCTGPAAEKKAASEEAAAKKAAAAMEETEDLNSPLRLPKDWNSFDGELAPALARRLHKKAHHQAESAEDVAEDMSDVAGETAEAAKRAEYRAERAREQLRKAEEEHKAEVKEAAKRARQRQREQRQRALAWKQARENEAALATGATGSAAGAASIDDDEFTQQLATPPPYTQEEVEKITAGPTGVIEVPPLGTDGATGNVPVPMAATAVGDVEKAADRASAAAAEAKAAATAAQTDAEARRKLEQQLRSTKSDAKVWARVSKRAKKEVSQQDAVEARAAAIRSGEDRAQKERVRIVQPEDASLLQVGEVTEGADRAEQAEAAIHRVVQDARKHASVAGTDAEEEGEEEPSFEPLPVAELEEGEEALQEAVVKEGKVVSMHARNRASLVASALDTAAQRSGEESVSKALNEAEAVESRTLKAAKTAASKLESRNWTARQQV